MPNVYVAPSSIAGDGLFAAKSFRKGDRVIGFRFKAARNKFVWKDMAAARSIPTDAAFVFNGKMLYDPKFTNQSKPMWYNFNHADAANTIIQKSGPMVAWYAARAIARDEELTFDYVEPDPSW